MDRRSPSGVRESHAPGSRIRRWIFPAIVSTALLAPNVAVVALGTEDFPFTSAPMFAHYVGPETTLYEFRFEGVVGDESAELPYGELGYTKRNLMRGFASFFYRPLSSTAPFRDLDPSAGTPEHFAEVMAGYFGPIAEFLRDARGLEYNRIDLYVEVVDSSGTLLRTELVGSYDVAADRYTHLYEVTG